MKKILLIISVIMVGFLSSACTAINVNSKAIQELNKKASQYLEEGDTKKAISRLEASLDLDETVFETRYNLAVAYIDANEYESAKEQLQKVIEINPEFTDAYYSMGVAQEGIAYSLISGDDSENTNEENYEEEPQEEERELTQREKEIIVLNLKEAIGYYEKYLAMEKEAKEKDTIQSQIENLKKTIIQYETPETSSEFNQTAMQN